MHTFLGMGSKNGGIHVLHRWMPVAKTHSACTIHKDRMWVPLWLDENGRVFRNLIKNGDLQRSSWECRRSLFPCNNKQAQCSRRETTSMVLCSVFAVWSYTCELKERRVFDDLIISEKECSNLENRKRRWPTTDFIEKHKQQQLKEKWSVVGILYSVNQCSYFKAKFWERRRERGRERMRQRERERERELISCWCFTPCQPLQPPQGEVLRERERERESKSLLILWRF